MHQSIEMLGKLLLRFVVGAVAGLFVGYFVARFAVKFYPPHQPGEWLAKFEEGQRLFQFRVLFTTVAIMALAAVCLGHLRLGASLRSIALGALGGVTVVVLTLTALVVAALRNEWPYRGKSPTTTVDWACALGIPLCGVLGGIAGYWLGRMRAKSRSASFTPHGQR